MTQRFGDGLQSLVSGLGTDRDKAASVYYAAPTLDDEQLINAYRTSWLARKIVDVPALDSCRAWRAWQAEGDQTTLIEAEEARLGLRRRLLDALTKARLFGGAAILIGTGDENPAEPLDPARISKGGIQYLTVLTRRHLVSGEVETDPLSPLYGMPRDYSVQSRVSGVVTIHPSRLVLLQGSPLPDDWMEQHAGWGDSVLISALDAIKQADGTAANIASLVFEAKIDVIHVPDLMNSLAQPEYEERLLKRYGLAATAKGNNGVLLLDGAETYEQKTGSFSTLPDVLDRFFQNASGAADIPMTRLFGQSPGGMNASGESDLRNYYDRISAGQELSLRPALSVLDECLIRSALGTRPPDVHYTWGSLWQISDKDRMEIGDKITSILERLNGSGLYPQEAVAEAGVNALVEHSVLPGLDQAVEAAGGLPEYEAEMNAATEPEAGDAEL